jgi:hypothetical protein
LVATDDPNNLFFNLGQEESFETFTFLMNGDLTTYDCELYLGEMPTEYAKLHKAILTSLSGEYQFYEDTISKPRVYEIKKWLKLSEIVDFKFFRQYYFDEFGASFFINKISGFNPDKSNQATTLEIIQTSYDRPNSIFVDNYYTDGVGEYFTIGGEFLY